MTQNPTLYNYESQVQNSVFLLFLLHEKSKSFLSGLNFSLRQLSKRPSENSSADLLLYWKLPFDTEYPKYSGCRISHNPLSGKLCNKFIQIKMYVINDCCLLDVGTFRWSRNLELIYTMLFLLTQSWTNSYSTILSPFPENQIHLYQWLTVCFSKVNATVWKL